MTADLQDNYDPSIEPERSRLDTYDSDPDAEWYGSRCLGCTNPVGPCACTNWDELTR